MSEEEGAGGVSAASSLGQSPITSGAGGTDLEDENGEPHETVQRNAQCYCQHYLRALVNEGTVSVLISYIFSNFVSFFY